MGTGGPPPPSRVHWRRAPWRRIAHTSVYTRRIAHTPLCTRAASHTHPSVYTQIGGQRVAMLTTQYRMYPSISRFPGRRFYDGALKDAPRMGELNAAPWHEKRALGPYVFYDVVDGVATESAGAPSWSNELEAQLAVRLVVGT